MKKKIIKLIAICIMILVICLVISNIESTISYFVVNKSKVNNFVVTSTISSILEVNVLKC